VPALEQAWDAIRRRHGDLPDAVVIVRSGSEGRARGLRLGQFAASRWSAGEGTLGEVFIAGEGLDRGAVHVDLPRFGRHLTLVVNSKYIILVKVLALNHLRVWVTG